MTETEALIAALAGRAGPVRRLRPPALRAVLWLGLAATVMAALAALHGVRPDLAARLAEARFMLATGAALATGVLAAFAAFLTSLPDRSRAWLLLPLPAAALWLGTMHGGCLGAWLAPTPGAPYAGPGPMCFVLLLACTVPLAGAMLLMLRHAAWLRPTAPFIAAGLAVAAMTAGTLALVHPMDTTALVLACDLGLVALLALADRLADGRLLARRPTRAAPRAHAVPGRPR